MMNFARWPRLTKTTSIGVFLTLLYVHRNVYQFVISMIRNVLALNVITVLLIYYAARFFFCVSEYICCIYQVHWPSSSYFTSGWFFFCFNLLTFTQLKLFLENCQKSICSTIIPFLKCFVATLDYQLHVSACFCSLDLLYIFICFWAC